MCSQREAGLGFQTQQLGEHSGDSWLLPTEGCARGAVRYRWGNIGETKRKGISRDISLHWEEPRLLLLCFYWEGFKLLKSLI